MLLAQLTAFIEVARTRNPRAMCGNRHVPRERRSALVAEQDVEGRRDPGDTAELACIGAALERLAQLLPPGLLVCADSALGHVKNLCAADRAGLRFVVPLRDASGFGERFLAEAALLSSAPDDRGARIEVTPGTAEAMSRRARDFCRARGWRTSAYARLQTIEGRTFLADVLCADAGN